MNVGLLADTHGLLRAQVLTAFAGVDHIVHAGDVGDVVVLEQLRTLAPLTAVRGNVDRGELAAMLPEVAEIDLAGVSVIVAHHREAAVGAAASASARGLVVFGHSHRPLVERNGDIVLVNPGSAGPRRFRLPVAVGLARLGPDDLDVEIVDLSV